MKLKCLIVDDEPMARKGLLEYVNEIEFLEPVAVCDSALKASTILQEKTVDLLLLDIQMPKLSGIDFVKSLSKPPLVIFTTAFPNYALEGYALDVVDYLLKPISFERFLKASQKACEIYILKNQSPALVAADHFFVKANTKFEKVLYKEVMYIESLQNYVIIHTPTRKLITYLTLSSLENQLPKDQFLKVHKSFIIGISHVNAIDGAELVIGESRIPISRTLRDDVVNMILGNKLFKR